MGQFQKGEGEMTEGTSHLYEREQYLGSLTEPERKYVAHCIRCGQTNALVMIPHRDQGNDIVGWVFSCQRCAPYLYGCDVVVTREVSND